MNIPMQTQSLLSSIRHKDGVLSGNDYIALKDGTLETLDHPNIRQALLNFSKHPFPAPSGAHDAALQAAIEVYAFTLLRRKDTETAKLDTWLGGGSDLNTLDMYGVHGLRFVSFYYKVCNGDTRTAVLTSLYLKHLGHDTEDFLKELRRKIDAPPGMRYLAPQYSELSPHISLMETYIEARCPGIVKVLTEATKEFREVKPSLIQIRQGYTAQPSWLSRVTGGWLSNPPQT